MALIVLRLHAESAFFFTRKLFHESHSNRCLTEPGQDEPLPPCVALCEGEGKPKEHKQMGDFTKCQVTGGGDGRSGFNLQEADVFKRD